MGAYSIGCATLLGMRLSSLLIIGLVATAACGPTPGATFPATSPEGFTEAESTAAPSDPAEPHENGDADPVNSPPAAAAITKTSADLDDHRRLLAGISLTAIGVTSAGLGGFLLGFGMGACGYDETNCAARVVLPIVGALTIAGGAIPMAFGVTLLASSPAALKTGRASPWPEVIVGPRAASMKWHF